MPAAEKAKAITINCKIIRGGKNTCVKVHAQAKGAVMNLPMEPEATIIPKITAWYAITATLPIESSKNPSTNATVIPHY